MDTSTQSISLREAARFQFLKSKPIFRDEATITQNVPGANKTLPSIML